jgi:alpha-ribazole phosphatase
MDRLNRIYLVRHGQVNGYENFPIYGHTDVGLTDTGILQMQQVAERLRLIDISAIYASDLTRAITSSRIISRYHDVPLYFLPELREMHFGDWEGLTMSEIQEKFPEELKRRNTNLLDFQAPGEGESIAGFSTRITDCFRQIRSKQNGNDIVIVVHGGVNRIILCQALGLDLSHMFGIQQDYGCLNIIDYYPDSTLVRLMNG